MTDDRYADIFTKDVLDTLFPPNRADAFFEALYGDAEDGAYDIHFTFSGYGDKGLRFEFHLDQRAGKCLACNLTYGLPEVFRRHPIININGLVQNIENHLDGTAKCVEWQIGPTHEISLQRHVIPLSIQLD